MHIEEMEEVEFDNNGRITKAKKVKNINVQNWDQQPLVKMGTF
jgi:hypothetical protein